MRKASAILLWVSLLPAQPRSAAEGQREMRAPPSLPFITEPVLPGEGWGPGRYRLRKSATVFDTWRSGHVVIARVPAGRSVTLLSGLNEVDRPGVIEISSPVTGLLLNPGDILLRYIQRGEGVSDFWAKGRWYTNGDLSWVRNADGSGCQTLCKAHEKEPGQSVWWFKIRLSDGRIGWTDSLDAPNLYR